jgi:prolyl oligopeptidase
MRHLAAALFSLGAFMTAPAFAADAASDPFLFMEEVEGERALAWVRSRNAVTLESLQSDPRYAKLEADALAIVRSRERLTFGGYTDGHVTNFWQDDRQIRGVWRKARFDGWRGGKPAWETILDVDALAKAEDRNWVFEGANCLDPHSLSGPCLVSLSIGGKDAAEQREFDRGTGRFAHQAGGFYLPEAKSGVAWRDAQTLVVGTDWGAGTLTESGYPFVVKLLARGAPLSEAREIFRGDVKDVGVWPGRVDDGTRFRNTLTRATTFFTFETYILSDDGTPQKLDLPPRHSFSGLQGETAFITLQEAWTPRGSATALPQGALVAAPLAQLIAREGPIAAEVVFAPGPRESLQGVSIARDGLYVSLTENVRGAVRKYGRGPQGWSFAPVDLPPAGDVGVADADPRSTRVFLSYNDMLTPPSILMSEGGGAPVTVQAQPAKFAAGDLVVQQLEATSRDGTKVPYFLIHKRGARLDGSMPTLLYGYGGFEVSMTPGYAAMRGKLWLERGGAYILANIRGGGEFGPAWHQAGLKTKRQVIYDDFIAVAEDAIARGVTSPRRLGIMGGSNGGLLMGAMLTQRPELFRAAVVQVPLLDMLRYHLLLAGASWVDEYGSPDVPEERAWLEQLSPYHRLEKRADFPIPFFVTSTKDDRVHPAHARKFAARMESLGMPFFYYENIDGGHSAAANLVEAARRNALEYTYLTRMLMD